MTAETRRRFLAYCSGAGLSSTLLPGVLWTQLEAQQAPRITVEMLKAAERIAGLEFTDAQRELLLSDVKRRRFVHSFQSRASRHEIRYGQTSDADE
jgi:hypothetical protein